MSAAFKYSEEALRQSTPLSAWEFAVMEAGAATEPDRLDACAAQWRPTRTPGADAPPLPDPDACDIWYRCRFAARPAGDGARQLLLFGGLATLATVWLNRRCILQSANMFLAHEVDVSGQLSGSNELLIRIASLGTALQQRRPRPRWRTRLVAQQQLRWFRTSLLGRMPGWTPPAPAIGPWRPVCLQQRRGFDWDQGGVWTQLEDDCGVVRVSLPLRAIAAGMVPAAARLRVGEHGGTLALSRLDRGSWQIEGELRLPGIRPWWPHTHGRAELYDLSLDLETSAGAVSLDLGRTGFRHAKLVSQDGAFGVRINGVDIFCRGTCWAPPDVLAPGADAESTRQALLLARDAGMNMLRVGGTMCYETGHFYDLCDELGILVWQDWMFASMDYPDQDPAFLASVEAEAKQFLRRTRQNPCLTLLCGNSEVEQQAAMLGLDRTLWRSPLFGEILPGIGARLRPDVPYWPSSPSGGDLPFQVDAGAAHYFGVGAYLRPLDDARRCGLRFASECLALANVPEAGTLEQLGAAGAAVHPAWKAGVPRDNGAGWDFEDVREHYLAELFRQDPMRLRYTDMERYLALSRVTSGEVMAQAFREWRRSGSDCGGALIWYLRDLVPGAGWGVVDAGGLPKACWYYLKRILAPLTLFILDEGLNGLALHAVNDGARPVPARLRLRLYRHGEQLVEEAVREIEVPARGKLHLRGDAVLGRFVDATYAYRFGPPGHDVVQAVLEERQTGAVLGADFLFPLGHGFAVEPSVGLEAGLGCRGEDGSYELGVSSRRFAQAVSIEAAGFIASDNYFHLEPGGSRRILLRPRHAAARLQASIKALNACQRVELFAQSGA